MFWEEDREVKKEQVILVFECFQQDDYYNVERITGDLDGSQGLKFKNSGIT